MSLVFIASAGFASVAHAATPTFSATNTGSGDNVQVNVTGDANSSVLLYFNSASSGVRTVNYIGTTNGSGVFSVVLSTASVGVASNSLVYVSVDNQISTSITWPYNSGQTVSTFSLSQTGLVLAQGQSSTVTASGNTGSLYMLSSSNPPVANVNISGNQITVTGNSYGSAVVTICSQSSSTSCPSMYVTVSQNPTGQPISFGQNNVIIAPGQNVPITITGGTGIYTVLSNTNSNVITTSINGAIITLSTTSSSGFSSITVCSSDISSCGIINVSIGTANASSTINFSPSNPTVPIGQTTSVIISSNSSTSYYISSNSSTSTIQANISGSTLSLYGITNGSSIITVCSSLGTCSPVTATVAGGSIVLSQNNISLVIGQTLTITASGGSLPYTLSSYLGSEFQATLSGDIITLYGVGDGSSSVNVCSTGGQGCTTLNVTVIGNVSSNQIVLSQSSVSLNMGQTTSITMTGSGGYYVSNNTNPNVASATISGNTANIYGINSGSTNISLCETGAQCTVVYVSVSGTSNTASTIALSQSSVSLNVGQTNTIYITGSGNYYVSSNTSPNIATVTINGSSAVVSALSLGSDTVSVCQNSGQCSVLSIGVISTSTQSASITASSSYQSVAAGNLVAFTVSSLGFVNPSYSLSDSYSGSSISSLDINASGSFSWTPTQNDVGTHNITVSATDSYGHSATALVQIIVTQNTSVSTTTTTTPTTPSYVFTRYLALGDTGADVLKLQQLLVQLGYLTATPTGHYGPATVLAVKKLQAAHGIKQLGNVGPATKTLINQLEGSSTTGATKQQQMQQIQAAIQQLENQLSALQ